MWNPDNGGAFKNYGSDVGCISKENMKGGIHQENWGQILAVRG